MTRPRSPGCRSRVCILVALLLLSCAPPARAQTRLYILFAGEYWYCPSAVCQPAQVLDIDIDARRLLDRVPVAHARESPAGPVVTPDGRYLAWMGTENASTAPTCLSILDTAARRDTPLICARTNWTGGTVLADPAAVRLYAQPFSIRGPATVIEPQGTRVIPMPCADGLLGDISGDGSRLLATCIGGFPGLSQTHVLDAATGQTVGTVSGPLIVAMDTDATHLYAAERPLRSTNIELSRYDVSTGAPVVSRLIPDAVVYGYAVYDTRTGWLALGVRDTVSGATGVRVFDGNTLADVGQLPAPFAEAFAHVVFDPDRAAAYVLWHASTTGEWRNRLAVYETAGFTSVAEAELGITQSPAGMVLGPRPPRAVGLTSTVAGTSVTLRWTLEASRSMATGLVVEAGSAPGLSNLARLTVAAGATRLTVPNVPPGSYHVRVRSVNGTGPGEPSNEVIVGVRP